MEQQFALKVIEILEQENARTQAGKETVKEYFDIPLDDDNEQITEKHIEVPLDDDNDYRSFEIKQDHKTKVKILNSIFGCKECGREYKNKLGLSCAKLRSSWG